MASTIATPKPWQMMLLLCLGIIGTDILHRSTVRCTNSCGWLPTNALPRNPASEPLNIESIGYHHPFHVCVAEAEWNATTGNLEVGLRMHPIDLENALTKLQKTKVDLDKTEEIDQIIQKYVAANFFLESSADTTGEDSKAEPGEPQENAAELIWAGKEISAKWAWIYFELKPKSTEQPLKLTNRLLMDVLSDQTNTVIVRAEKRKQSLVFRRNETTLRFPRFAEVDTSKSVELPKSLQEEAKK